MLRYRLTALTENLEKNTTRFLHVKAEKFKIFWLLFLFSFLANFALNIMYSIPMSMFLSRYESSALPYIYMGAGAITAFFGSLFIFLKQKHALFYLLIASVTIVSVSLLTFWVIFIFLEAAWLYYLFYIWSWSACIVLETIYAILINQIFNLQEGKRLFGLLAGGAALGGIASGLSMNFLIDWIGIVNLIFLSAQIVFACLPLMVLIRTQIPNIQKIEVIKKIKFSQIDIFKNRGFIFFLLAISVAFTCQYYAFDLFFNTEVKNYFQSEKEMANFYSHLFALYHLFALLISFFAYSWILRQFGLFASLHILPLGMGICILAVLIVDAFFEGHSLYFWLLAFSALFENIARSAIYTQSVLLLFQPLAANVRAWLQVQVEFKVIPIAIASIGILMCILNWYGPLSDFYNCLIILCFASLIFACILILKQGYMQTLMENVSHRKFSNQSFMKVNKDNLDFLKGKMTSRFPDEIIYVLQIIENMDLAEFTKVIEKHLNYPSAFVRKYMLEKIAQHKMQSTKPQLIDLCLREKDPQILSKALLALAAITDIDSLPWYREYMYDKNTELATSAIVAGIKFGDAPLKQAALAIVNKKAHSIHSEDLILALEVSEHITLPCRTNLILDGLRHPCIQVRQKACQAATFEADSILYPLLFENLASQVTHKYAFNVLARQSSLLVDYIALNFDHFPLAIQLESIKIIGYIQSQKSLFFLEKLLHHSNRKILRAVVAALSRNAYLVHTQKKQKTIRCLLNRENDNILFLRLIASAFSFYQARALVGLLNREIEVCQECCFCLLSFIYPQAPIMHAMNGLSFGDDLVDYAEEILLNTLGKKDIETFLPQLMYRAIHTLPAMQDKGRPLAADFAKILDYAPTSYLTGLAAAVVYTIGALPFEALMGAVPTYQSMDDPFLEEIKAWVIKKS